MTSKKTIAIDIDDVLAAQVEAFILFSNEQWGTRLTVNDYDEHWGRMWRIEHDVEETERRAHAFFDSGTMGKLRHFSEASPVLKGLSAEYRLILVTARRQRLIGETNAWIRQYFPDMFQDIHYTGAWDNTNPNRHAATKGELCRELGASYLIDDQLKHCLAASECGVTALLFGNYAWNYTDHLPKGVRRVANWQEVKEFFDAKD